MIETFYPDLFKAYSLPSLAGYGSMHACSGIDRLEFIAKNRFLSRYKAASREKIETALRCIHNEPPLTAVWKRVVRYKHKLHEDKTPFSITYVEKRRYLIELSSKKKCGIYKKARTVLLYDKKSDKMARLVKLSMEKTQKDFKWLLAFEKKGIGHHFVPTVYIDERKLNKVSLYQHKCNVPDLGRIFSEQQQLSYKQRLSIAVEVTAALAALHAREIVHADIKPANILVHKVSGCRFFSSIHGYLTDFGLSFDVDSSMWSKGRGTMEYYAPEQWAHVWNASEGTTTGSPRAKTHVKQRDVWALGCVLFQLFTGAPPPCSYVDGNADMLELTILPWMQSDDDITKEEFTAFYSRFSKFETFRTYFSGNPKLGEVFFRMLISDPSLRISAEKAAALFSKIDLK